MNRTSFIIVPALALALGFAGCDNNGTARSEYPDRSQETKAEADAIRLDGQRREEVIDQELQQTLTAQSFVEKQNADKAKLERERIAIDRDRTIQPLEAKKTNIEDKAKRDCERIDHDTEAKVATVAGDEAARIKAEAASQTAEIKRDATAKTAEIDKDIREAKEAAQTRLAKVDESEAKVQADSAAKRTEAENKAREEKLKVKSDTTAKLDRLGKTSAERQQDQRARDADIRQSDEHITAEVQKNLARHGDSARGVTVATDNGVVVLGGTVNNDSVRQQVASDAQRISGVVRVDNKIAVH